MLMNQRNATDENKEYMKVVQEREEQSYQQMVEPLENEIFEKACKMEEKAMLIEQYYSQIVKMQSEIDEMQKEVDAIEEEIQLRRVNTEKISLAKATIEKVTSLMGSIKEMFTFRSESIERDEVEEAISDVRQSNLEEDKKKRLYRVLDKLIELLSIVGE
jgi:uroporphyrinogen-III decarboxylase